MLKTKSLKHPTRPGVNSTKRFQPLVSI